MKYAAPPLLFCLILALLLVQEERDKAKLVARLTEVELSMDLISRAWSNTLEEKQKADEQLKQATQFIDLMTQRLNKSNARTRRVLDQLPPTKLEDCTTSVGSGPCLIVEPDPANPGWTSLGTGFKP